MNASVIIIGGGLAGLYAAHLLHEAGIDFILFEARDRLGGRILSADEHGLPSKDGFDLGPSWIWPKFQPPMAALINKLKLDSFSQHRNGDVIIQRAPPQGPRRYRANWPDAHTRRLVGGSAALVDALATSLPSSSLHQNSRVHQLTLKDRGVQISFLDHLDAIGHATASHVILALPPRLIEATISFLPLLSRQTARRLRETPTWMAPHAKFFAIYDQPFWRNDGLSGAAQSTIGPLSEIHDAVTASGQAALFGFVGISAAQRSAIGRELLMEKCLQQLGSLFGQRASNPRATLLKDWAVDPFTATRRDQIVGNRPAEADQYWLDEAWAQKALLAGSEVSPTEPGLLAGAVRAAERAVDAVINNIGATRCEVRSSC